jgi:Tol biopolymer transport system component
MLLVAAALVALATASTSVAASASSPGANGLIAYVKRGPACPAPECGEALWVSALDGSGARRLKVSKTIVRSILFPTWSPDGKRIAFFDLTGGGGEQGNPQRPPLWHQLWVINADGSGRRVVLDFRRRDPRTYFLRLRPSWTSNSREVTYQTEDALWAVDVGTRRIRRLAGLPKLGGSAQLSPDGKRIAYTNAAGDLYVMSSTGGGKTRLARISTWGFNDSFDWSPDSRKLAVLSESGAPSIVSVAGGVGPPLVAGPDRWERPIWSPDGSTLLSQRQQVPEPDPDRPGSFRTRMEWDRFTTIDPGGRGVALVGPGTGSCGTRGQDPRTGKRLTRPCQIRDPSWQPRR